MILVVIFNNGIADENLEKHFQSYLTVLKKYYPASGEQNIADGVYACYNIMIREGGTDKIFNFLDEFKAYTI